MKIFSLISIFFIIDSFRYGSCGGSSTNGSGISESDYCPIAIDLSTCGLPQDQLAHWTCLVYYVSKGNATLKATVNGVNSYGMFQFNSRIWCSESDTPGKSCNARCNDFLNYDLNDDCACAMKVYNTNSRGFNPWNFWAASCNTKPLPDLSLCGF